VFNVNVQLLFDCQLARSIPRIGVVERSVLLLETTLWFESSDKEERTLWGITGLTQCSGNLALYRALYRHHTEPPTIRPPLPPLGTQHQWPRGSVPPRVLLLAKLCSSQTSSWALSMLNAFFLFWKNLMIIVVFGPVMRRGCYSCPGSL
jgi:hypothetical protein